MTQPERRPTLQASLNLLQGSAHLGVVIASEHEIIDANDAFLSMIGYKREEMQSIDWMALTPPEYLPLDKQAIEQMRLYGACVPFEKEYVLRDGRRIPFMIGGVRLQADPLHWAAYTVDLSEHNQLAEAKRQNRELEAKAALLSQLAHDINNPLAALTFVVHLLQTHPEVGPGAKELVAQAEVMLTRISQAVQEVVRESSDQK